MIKFFLVSDTMFDEAVGQSGACTVAVRYTDPDDKVLAEREFKAQ